MFDSIWINAKQKLKDNGKWEKLLTHRLVVSVLSSILNYLVF